MPRKKPAPINPNPREKSARGMLFVALVMFLFSFIPNWIGWVFLALTFFCFGLAIWFKAMDFNSAKQGFLWFFNFFRQITDYFYAMLLLSFIIGITFQIAEIEDSKLDQSFMFAPPIIYLVMGILAGPLEELIFRGGILNLCRKWIFKWTRYKDYIALVISSALFAWVHILLSPDLYLIWYLVPTFVLGLFLGWVYLRRGLVEVMWLHSFYNMTIMFLGYMTTHGWKLA